MNARWNSVVRGAALGALALFIGHAQGGGADDAKVDRLIAALGADDYDSREGAYQALKGMGESVRAALDQALVNGDVDVKFAARRLLDALGDDIQDLRSPPGDRQGSTPFGSRPRLPRFRFDPQGGLGRGEDLQQWNDEIDQWNQEMDAWIRQLLGDGAGGPGQQLRSQPPGNERWRSSGTSVSIDEQGRVKVHLQRDENGQQVDETYEADSLEEFTSKYPEVAARAGLGSRLRLFGGGEPRAFGTPFRASPGGVPQADGPRLGVQVRVLSPSAPMTEGPSAGLEKGLLVVSVVAGSLGDELGVRAEDILVKVGEREIAGVDDVREALIALGDKSVTVSVIRNGKPQLLAGGRRF